MIDPKTYWSPTPLALGDDPVWQQHLKDQASAGHSLRPDEKDRILSGIHGPKSQTKSGPVLRQRAKPAK